MRESSVHSAFDFSLESVRIMAWVTLTLVFLLVVGLLGLRWVRWRAEPRKAAFRQQWSAILMRCAMGDDLTGQLPALRSRERWPWMLLWLHFQMSLKGPSCHALAKLGRTMGCSGMAMAKLGSPYAPERLMAILALGFLKDAQAQTALQAPLQEGSNQTAVYAARALLELDVQTHAAPVIGHLLVRPDLDFSLVSVLLKPFRQALADALMDCRHVLQPPALSSPAMLPNPAAESAEQTLQWLRLARALNVQMPGEVLASCLEAQQDAEVLMAAMRLVQDASGVAAVRLHAAHQDWRVRAQVAQALGQTGAFNDAQRLVQMATDAQWWVRYRAIQALLKMPGMGPHQALSLVEATGDRYALNMLQAALAEKGVTA
jgi:HEAT repeat protein